jgi:hypothetical protein
MINSYFDESVRNNELLCVAGFSFASEQAKKFIKEWKKLFPIGLHMKEFAHGVGRYKGLYSPEERDAMMRTAVKIINSRMTVGFAVSCNIKEMNLYSPKWIHGFKSAYSLCCHWAVHAMLIALDDAGIKDRITYIFEAGNQHEYEAKTFFQSLVDVPHIKEQYRHLSDSFTPKSDAVPLQAADLLAYEWAKFYDETYTVRKRAMRGSLRALFEHAPERYRLNHIHGKKLQNAMNKYRNLAHQQIAEESIMRRVYGKMK